MEPKAAQERHLKAAKIVREMNEVLSGHRQKIEEVVRFCVGLIEPTEDVYSLAQDGRLTSQGLTDALNSLVHFDFYLDGERLVRATTTYTEEGDEESISTTFEYGPKIVSWLSERQTRKADPRAGGDENGNGDQKAE